MTIARNSRTAQTYTSSRLLLRHVLLTVTTLAVGATADAQEGSGTGIALLGALAPEVTYAYPWTLQLAGDDELIVSVVAVGSGAFELGIWEVRDDASLGWIPRPTVSASLDQSPASMALSPEVVALGFANPPAPHLRVFSRSGSVLTHIQDIDPPTPGWAFADAVAARTGLIASSYSPSYGSHGIQTYHPDGSGWQADAFVPLSLPGSPCDLRFVGSTLVVSLSGGPGGVALLEQSDTGAWQVGAAIEIVETHGLCPAADLRGDVLAVGESWRTIPSMASGTVSLYQRVASELHLTSTLAIPPDGYEPQYGTFGSKVAFGPNWQLVVGSAPAPAYSGCPADPTCPWRAVRLAIFELEASGDWALRGTWSGIDDAIGWISSGFDLPGLLVDPAGRVITSQPGAYGDIGPGLRVYELEGSALEIPTLTWTGALAMISMFAAAAGIALAKRRHPASGS